MVSSCMRRWGGAYYINANEDWDCSPECEANHGYIYCLCKQKRSDAIMVQCALEGDCTRSEWYHVQCLGKEENDLPEVWYCCEECALGAGDDDHVLNHSKALIWEGLNLLVRRDSVREGDGPAIISHWKLDMLQYWNNNHPKYFISGCHLLAGVGGFLEERLREDLIWKRVGNLSGSVGGNIGLDMVNEFINKDFKDMLKHCHGRYTDNQVQRVAQMSGANGRNLDKLFTQAGLGSLETHQYVSKATCMKTDVKKFVQDYQPDALLDYLPVRAHKGFEGYVPNRKLRCPSNMGCTLAKLAIEKDFWRELAAELVCTRPTI